MHEDVKDESHLLKPAGVAKLVCVVQLIEGQSICRKINVPHIFWL